MSEIPPSNFPIRETAKTLVVQLDLNESLKIRQPAFFGYCFDILLYGCLTVQVYLYHLAFPNDKKLTKAAVYLVYTIGSIQTAFALRDFSEMFCFPGGLVQTAPDDMHTFGFMWLTIPVSSALAAVTVQLFYAQRIWMVSHSKSITLAVGFLALAQLGCGIFSAIVIYGVLSAYRDSSVAVTRAFIGRAAAGTIFNAVVSAGHINLEILEVTIDILKALGFGRSSLRSCDCSIHVCSYLKTNKRNIKDNTKISNQNQATFVRDWAIDRSVTFAAMSYIPLSVLSTGDSTLFMVPGLLLSKLYSNSMLAVLNNRVLIDKGRYAGHTAEITFYEPSVATGT
ncbi:hypothetical protein D9756_000955 [Leucocoprinus leucothites]|uniref:Uncharacterized protein n=1 Tax=Leucocoprinus leucothites TaxID=201217 RepID=A0A8H5GEZ0_9AGAR|nr:hypothetical protein D9756_000955 [Leucoagaricus leucothites]